MRNDNAAPQEGTSPGPLVARIDQPAVAAPPLEVRLSLLVLLRHVEPGWDNCVTVVRAWLDGKL